MSNLGVVEGIPALVSGLGVKNTELLLKIFSAKSGDLILFAVGHHASVNKTLDRLRTFTANDLDLVNHVSLIILVILFI